MGESPDPWILHFFKPLVKKCIFKGSWYSFFSPCLAFPWNIFKPIVNNQHLLRETQVSPTEDPCPIKPAQTTSYLVLNDGDLVRFFFLGMIRHDCCHTKLKGQIWRLEESTKHYKINFLEDRRYKIESLGTRDSSQFKRLFVKSTLCEKHIWIV